MRRLQRLALFIFFFSINFEVWDPFNTNGFFSISKLTGYVYLITMIPLLIHISTTNTIKYIIKPILIFFGLLTLVSIININTSSYSFFDFSIFQNIVLLWILMYHEQYQPLVLEKGIFSFALGSVILALLFNAGIGIDYEGGRVSIFGDNQNNVGMRMSISIIILLTILLQNRLQLGKFRYLLLTPIPLMLTLMAESGSRLAFISFILSFIIGGFLFKTRKIWTKAMIMVIGTLAFIAIWQFLLQNEILSIRLLQSVQEGDISERDIIWQRLLPLVKNNPIFGVGKTGYAFFAQATFGQATSPHNVILEVLCLTGIIGLIIYLIFLYRVFKRIFNLYRTEDLLLPLLLTLPIFGLLLSGQILYVKIGWVIFAYIASCENNNNIQKETIVQPINENTLRNR